MYCIVILVLLAMQIYAFSYEGYKVFKIIPAIEEHFRVLEMIYITNQLDIWSQSRIPNVSWVMMADTNQSEQLETTLNLSNMKYEIINSNFQITVLKEKYEWTFRKEGGSKSPLDETNLMMDHYYNYDTMRIYMKNIVRENPNRVHIITIGRSSENRYIQGVKISNPNAYSGKPTILIDAGMYGREWMGPAMALYIISQLAQNPYYSNMSDNVDWYIFPVINPDGYNYTFTKDRMWRKTRSKRKNTHCMGADINRNFDYHWNTSGIISSNECDDNYIGSTAFSEIETLSLAKFTIEHSDEIRLYLSFQSFGTKLVYPWSWTPDYPEVSNKLHQIGENVANAIKSVRGTEYVVGSSANVLYMDSGCSLDWMKGRLEIPLAYVMKLPGMGDSFDPPATEIQGITEETFEGIKIFHKYVEETWA